MTKLKNICLALHCIRQNNGIAPVVHNELFINLDDLEMLIDSLKTLGYSFLLPKDVGRTSQPTCSITFDDGYFNNMQFLPVAERYNIPFILFVSSYNIDKQVPFLWDIAAKRKPQVNPTFSINYRRFYENLDEQDVSLLKDDNYRPFTMDEFNKFSAHSLVYLAAHGHTHQPLIRGCQHLVEAEIAENKRFLSAYPNFLSRDFALPCGLYTSHVKRKLLLSFDRIYTINGGGLSQQDRIINRISLVNPSIGGDLLDQVHTSFSFMSNVRRRAVNYYYSYRA